MLSNLSLFPSRHRKHSNTSCATTPEKTHLGKWNPLLDVTIALLQRKTDDSSALQEVLDHLIEKTNHEPISPAYFAFIYPLIGNYEEGLKWLNKAIKQKDTLLWDFRVHPLLEEVWSDPNYMKILSQVGFLDSNEQQV
jgi:hypothetical protein